MKALFSGLLLFTLVQTACIHERTIIVDSASQQEAGVTYQVFYDNLSPYGHWVVYQDYGYVWIPDVGPDFAPYSTMGYWVYTSYGWTWTSYYNWGWATFHYGRWGFDPIYGWYWVPGYEWAPAWVVWRSCPGYYGWAPIGPGISVAVAFGPGYYPPTAYWMFVDYHYLGSHDIYNHYGPRSDYDNNIRNSTVINVTKGGNGIKNVYSPGPSIKEVQANSSVPIQQVTVREASKPGENVTNNELSIYHPSVGTPGSNDKIAPAKVTSLNDVKPVQQRPVQQNNVQPQQPDRQIQQNKPVQQIQQPIPQPRQQPAPQPQPRQQPAPQPQPRQQPQRQVPQPRPQPQPRQAPQQKAIPSQPQRQVQPRQQPSQKLPQGKKQRGPKEQKTE